MTRTPKPSPAHEEHDAASAGRERLQKFLSRCGVASRRAAEELIAQGRVEVNGRVVEAMGVQIDPFSDEVRVDGERLRMPTKRMVLVLNKPTGYLCAASDPESRDLVYRLVPKDQALRSIGRLDFNTEGVLLFTNDGDLAERLGHARYAIQRVYEARVRGIPSEETLAKLRLGVRLEDGPARAEQVEIVKQTDKNAWLKLTLIEGRNREVRRLLERVGHPVVRLRRISFAGITTAGLKLGEYRALDEAQIEQLRTRGHVGAFELPPDPRRKKAATVGLSTGPVLDPTTQRRGKGRADSATEQLPRPARRSKKVPPSLPMPPPRPGRGAPKPRPGAGPGARPTGRPGGNQGR